MLFEEKMDIRKHLQQLHEDGNYREIPTVGMPNVTDYSTNDYLGLAADTTLQTKFFADPVSATVPMTSSASRLLAPRQIEYTNLEIFLSLLYKKYRGDDTAALIFNSGYHANTGLMQSIADRDTLILADRLVHASIIDGIVLSRAQFKRFPHNDFDRLAEMLASEANRHNQIIVAVESVYSMDGDRADIDRLIKLKQQYGNVVLYVDEAHAFGVLGPRGLGLVAASEAPGEVDIVVGTFGKAAASMGAFAITSVDMRDYLVNNARSFIFSTALPPMTVAWTRFTIGNLIRKEDRRKYLAHLGVKLSEVINRYSDHKVMPSHIQPLIVGDPKVAVELSRRLLTRYGIKALPIRKPTVAAGTERLRFSLSSAMMPGDIEALDQALAELI